MGKCFSRSEPEVRPSRNPARLRLVSVRTRRDDYDAPAICSQCQRPCDHTEGRFYLKCLQCANNFNICDRCLVKDHNHPVHVYAYVDNVDRHRFMQQIAKQMEGTPILKTVPFVDSRPRYTLKCSNLTADDNHQPKKCLNQISWMCLQCVTAFALCQSCMALPSQHSLHVFAMASSDNLHNVVLAQLNSGLLPLSLNRTEE